MTTCEILLFAANPFDDLKLDEEIRAIEHGLQSAKFRQQVRLNAALATRPGDLIDKLSQFPARIVQFSGHASTGEPGGAGSRDVLTPDSSAGQIVLEDDFGAAKFVSTEALGDLFHYRKGQIRLVVLNACGTLPQAEAIRQHIDCVVGTNRSIGDRAARVFSARFYQTLAEGESVRQAFDAGRTELKLQGIHEAETLILLAREGVDPALVVLIGTVSSAEAKEPQPVAPSRLWGWVSANRMLLGLLAGALAVLLAAPFGLASALRGLTGSKVAAYLLLAIPLAAVVGFHAIPAFLARRRARRLLDEGLFGKLKEPGFFRVHPYGDNDKDRSQFERADGAHDDVLRWLRTTTEPILYLSGGSGTGKSSLLYSYVLPKLREDSPAVRQVVVRSFHDPLEALRREVIALLPLDQRAAAETTEIRPVLATAATASSGRFLVVFDQFEEFLILSGRAPERLKAFESLIVSLSQEPVPGLQILIVFRSDYLGALQKLNLSKMDMPENWREISAFRPDDSRRFLLRSGLTIGDQALDRLMDQLAEVEDVRGLIKPITLNMVGLVLERMASDREAQILGIDRLFDRYLEDALDHPDVRSHARKVLGRMITSVGTNRARSVGEIAQQTEIEPHVVTGVLLRLGNAGLVRRIDPIENVWEIAHDFVAHRLRNQLQPTPMQVIRPYVAPALVAAGLLAIAATAGRSFFGRTKGPDVGIAGHLEPQPGVSFDTNFGEPSNSVSRLPPPPVAEVYVFDKVREALKSNLMAADQSMTTAFRDTNGRDPDCITRVQNLRSYVDAPGRNKLVALYKSLTKKDTIDAINRADIEKIIVEEVVVDPRGYNRGLALTIGLNQVDKAFGAGVPNLSGCENDARDMARAAAERGFEVRKLLASEATLEATRRELKSIAKELKEGDLFLLSFSGHIFKRNEQARDILFYDGQMSDHEFIDLLSGFAPGLHMIVVIDSSHARLFDQESFAAVNFFRGVPPRLGIVLLAACKSDQTAADLPENGLFTDSILRTLNHKRFDGNYHRLASTVHDIVVEKAPNQSPQLILIGEEAESMALRRAFLIK